MPPRPALKSKESRPTSAIYLGSSPLIGGPSSSKPAPHSPPSSSPYLTNGTPPDLPDVPEPPSPDSSVGSRGSGLPSPPATNSTGSGSTGDPGSIALRQRPLSFASDSSASTSSSSHRTLSEFTSMHTASSSSRSASRQSQRQDDDWSQRGHDDDDDVHENNDLDGDETARLDRRYHSKSSSENMLALQRVKSLTQRNRMAIDKLTRLGSPSPSNQGRSTGSRSPVPSQTSSSSRLRAHSILQPLPQDQGASGSETERESTSVQTYSSHSHSSSSSSRRPITPPPGNTNVALAGPSSPYSRHRHISAPDSPQKARLLNATPSSSTSSNSPSNRRRKRASMASLTAIQAYDDDDDDDNGGESRFATATGTGRDRLRDHTVRDITQSAMAAVAMSRRSPLGTRKRGALPKEFTEGNGEDIKSVASTRRSEDLVERKRLSTEPVTPYRSSGVGRSSTLREGRRVGLSSSRWVSEDHRDPTVEPGSEGKRERRQTLRGGSAESALWSPGGRTLLSEGLRAAGLGFRREDVRTLGAATSAADLFRDRERRADQSPQDAEDKGTRRVFPPARELSARAATSMAHYRSMDRKGDEDDEDRPVPLRNHRSTYSLTKDRDLSLTRKSRDLSLTRTERDQLELDRGVPMSATATSSTPTVLPKHLQERHSTSSPYGSRRISQTPVPGAAADHVRLMLETLGTFEGNVAKLPPTAVSNLGKIPPAAELIKHAQNVIYTTERINTLMRQGTNRALEEQINAEVEGDGTAGAQEMLEVWRRVGGEYREGLRASDELVRALTSFLIDIGSTLRKLSPSSGTSEYGSPATHARSMSLDEDGIRQHQRSAAGSDVSGRQSVDSSVRRSWDPALRDRERERDETLRKLASGPGRESSLSLARASPALGATWDRERNIFDTPSPASSASKPLPTTQPNLQSSVRRLFTPSQQRDRQLEGQMEGNRPGSSLRPSDSQKTVQGNEVEPSPTPVSRTRDRMRPLPLTAGSPLPRQSLPPESRRTPVGLATTNSTSSSSASMEKSNSIRDRDRTHERRKPSVASIVTVRGTQAPTFPGLTTPSSATTSITAHTVSNSPEQVQTPTLMRTDSTRLARASVTFSRPVTSSVSAALSDIQKQARDDERRRTTSTSDPPQPKLEVQQQPKKLAAIALAKTKSASEAERDTNRKGSPRLSVGSGEEGGLPTSASAPFSKGSTSHPADRHAASTVLPRTNSQRRRTVTDIWPRE